MPILVQTQITQSKQPILSDHSSLINLHPGLKVHYPLALQSTSYFKSGHQGSKFPDQGLRHYLLKDLCSKVGDYKNTKKIIRCPKFGKIAGEPTFLRYGAAKDEKIHLIVSLLVFFNSIISSVNTCDNFCKWYM